MERILAYDTETTGLKPDKGHRPLTVGLVALDSKLRVVDTLEVKVWAETFVLDPKALEINGIDIDAHKRNALPPNEAVRRITAFIGRNYGDERPIPLGHNEHFDNGMVSALYKMAGKDFDRVVHYRRLDTCSTYRLLQDCRALPFLAGRRCKDAYKNAKLDTALAAYGIEFEGDRHTALADALATAKLFKAMRRSLTPWYRRLYNFNQR